MESATNIPLVHVVPYLSLKDLCQARLASRQFYIASKEVFSPSQHTAILYNKFLKGLVTKHLTNTTCSTLLHLYMLPYYEKIKTLRKNMNSSGERYTIQATLLDFPRFVYGSFDHLLNPETGTKARAEEVIKNRVADPKLYSQMFHTTDLRVTLTNSLGHTLKIAKQWIMPTNAFDLEDSSEESKEKYKVFYDEVKDLAQVDFANQVMLCKRQEELLEQANMQKTGMDIFGLVNRIGLWIILLCHGGSFSIGIFDGMKVIMHKSDKKYLVRKKAGKRQLNKDKVKTSMTSMGSQMRREMEKMHQENVANIMEECQQYLTDSQAIFLHAPGINRLFFLSEGKPLKPYMNKIKPIISHTKKANFENVMEVFEKLTAVTLTFNNTQ